MLEHGLCVAAWSLHAMNTFAGVDDRAVTDMIPIVCTVGSQNYCVFAPRPFAHGLVALAADQYRSVPRVMVFGGQERPNKLLGYPELAHDRWSCKTAEAPFIDSRHAVGSEIRTRASLYFGPGSAIELRPHT